MKPRKILYLSYDGMTDPLGQSQVIPYLAGLSQKGHKFVLVSFEKKHRLQFNREQITRELAKHDIRWVPLPYHKNPPVVSTITDIYLLRKTAKRLHREHKFDVVHCRSYITSLVGIWLKKHFRIKFIFDMRGFWADERVEGGLWPQQNALFRHIYLYFKNKEIEFLSEADYTISLTEVAKKEIHSWHTVKNNPIPIKVIPCCADLQLFNPKNVKDHQITALKDSLGILAGSFVMLYVGSVGTWYLLDEMLDFFKILIEDRPNAVFLIVTKDDTEPIRRLASKKQIAQHRIIIASAERHMMPTYIMLAQIAIIFIKPVFSKKASSPTKQGEIMGMGIPIICNKGVGDTEKIVRETNASIVIEELSEREYKKACSQLDLIDAVDKSNIVMGAVNHYSLETGIDQYNKVYEHLTY